MPIPRVLDLSHWNAIDSWEAITEAGIGGVILKATEGSDYADPTYRQRVNEARQAGLLVGAYHFMRPGNMEQQAVWFLETVLDASGTNGMLLAADHEDTGVSLNDLKQFLAAVENASNIIPAIYSGNVIKSQVGSESDAELAHYPLWLAQWSAQPSWPQQIWPNWFLWQYTGSGTCLGINGSVDLDAYAGPDLSADWSRS